MALLSKKEEVDREEADSERVKDKDQEEKDKEAEAKEKKVRKKKIRNMTIEEVIERIWQRTNEKWSTRMEGEREDTGKIQNDGNEEKSSGNNEENEEVS